MTETTFINDNSNINIQQHTTTHKTPSYTLKAIHDYNKRNLDKIKERNKLKYHNLTPEKKAEYILKQKIRLQNMTPEQKQIYNEKQRLYRQNYRAKKKLLKNTNETDITHTDITQQLTNTHLS